MGNQVKSLARARFRRFVCEQDFRVAQQLTSAAKRGGQGTVSHKFISGKSR
jgi:hypothetical protein